MSRAKRGEPEGQPLDEEATVRITKCVFVPAVRNRRGGTYVHPKRWTFYTCDEEGVERVYAEFALNDDQECQTWQDTNPLFRQMQSGWIKKLLSDPRTRDLVILINMQAAKDRGDMDTVKFLAKYLSAEALDRLIGERDNTE
jgi:hypothetical protein